MTKSQTPNNYYEKKLAKKGYKLTFGLDEVGRGAWAGPIVAACIFLPLKTHRNKTLKLIKDSKLLTYQKREKIFNYLNKKFIYGIGRVTEKVIDKIGISQANTLAMKRAIQNAKYQPDWILVDGIKFSYKRVPCETIIKGDRKVISIAAASIIAKVRRDKIMKRYHKKFTQYSFDQHKGYGTKKHYQLLCQHGICQIHRKTFRPMRNMV